MRLPLPLPELGRFDAAIIDLDGTLVDTLADFTAALNATLAELALPPLSATQVEAMVGKGSEFLVRSALEAVGASPACHARAFGLYQHHYGVVNGRHARLYEGAASGVARLRAHRMKLACVTNKPQAFAESLLRDLGLRDAFDVVFGGDAFEERKPHPMPLQMACRALGCEPARTLVVGDSVNDAVAARAAGCPVVLVTYGYNHGQPVQQVDADGFIDALTELAP